MTLVIVENIYNNGPEPESYLFNEINSSFQNKPSYLEPRIKSLPVQADSNLLETIHLFAAEPENDFDYITFFIDVHLLHSTCKFYQSQGGVDAFRNLLTVYNDKLLYCRFIFCSFIDKSNLVYCKPTNEILNHYHVLTNDFTREKLIKSLDQVWSDDYDVFFNNASENLLAGWAIHRSTLIDKNTGRKHSPMKDRHILVIDDEFFLWKTLYSVVFKGITVRPIFEEMVYYKYRNYKSRPSIQENCIEQIKNITLDSFSIIEDSKISEKIENSFLIISDLYLLENHREDFSSTLSNNEEISGYKLFKKIIQYNPAASVVMFTSSNKVWNYQLFDSAGIEGWIVKQTNPVNKKQLEGEYKFYEATIKSATSEERRELTFLWKQISSVIDLKSVSDLWWFKNMESANESMAIAKKDLIFQILKESFIASRRMFVTYSIREKNFLTIENGFDAFTCSSIISKLGTIIEIIYDRAFDKDGGKKWKMEPRDDVSVFIYDLRNSASHALDYKFFTLLDVLIIAHYVCALLKYNGSKEQLLSHYPPIKRPAFEAGSRLEDLPLWNYLYFESGSPAANLSPYGKTKMDQRIKSLFNKLGEKWKNKHMHNLKKLNRYK